MRSKYQRPKRKRTRRALFRPAMETLESRHLLATIQWVGSGDGQNWDDARNWNSNSLPTSGDDVIISVAGNPAITHRMGTNHIKSLVSASPVTLAGGTLHIATTATLSNSLSLSGGILSGATVTATSGGKVQLTTAGGTLSGVTIAAGVVVDATQKPPISFSNPRATIHGGLTFHGTLNLGSVDGTVGGELNFQQSNQTLQGNGTVVFGGSSANGLFAEGSLSGQQPVTLTIGSGITIQGGVGSVSGRYQNDSVIHRGSLHVSSGGSISVGGKNWSNEGTLTGAAGSSITFVGSSTLAALGTLNSSGTVNIASVLDNTGTTLTLAPARGNWRLAGGTIQGGTIASTGGAKLALTGSGGTLSGVTIAAGVVVDASHKPQVWFSHLHATIVGGLTLHGTLHLGSTDGTVSGELVFQQSHQTLAGTGTVVLGSSTGNGLISQGSLFTGQQPVTLTIGSGITVQGGSGTIGGRFTHDSLINQGSIFIDSPGSTIKLTSGSAAPAIVNEGHLTAANGASFQVEGSLRTSASSIVSIATSSQLTVTGDLLNSVQETPRFTPQGTVLVAGAGKAAQPQLLEVMSEDLGNSNAGFTSNFSLRSVIVRNGTYAKLVDQMDNSPGGSEVLYVDSISVAAGATLDLNGLRVYARSSQVTGSIINGTFTSITKDGVLPFNTAVTGSIGVAGQTDEWTIYGWSGRQVTVSVNPGTTGLAPIAPQLNWAKVELLNAAGSVVASAAGTQSGQAITLSHVSLPATGAYRIRVSAAAGQASSVGNYLLTVWDTTPSSGWIGLNELTAGSIGSPFGDLKWMFAANANSQVQLKLLARAFGGLGFSLTGPDGFTGFSNIALDSDIITLPLTGVYTLFARGSHGSVGDLAFELNQINETTLIADNPFRGSLFSSGQSQRFSLQVTNPGPVKIDLQGLTQANQFQFFGSFGQAPTRLHHEMGLMGGASGSHSLLFNAQPGTYRFLLYSDLVKAPEDFTIQVTSAPLFATAVIPNRLGNSQPGTLVLKGLGFDAQTDVSMVAKNGVLYRPARIELQSSHALVLHADLPNWPAGKYDVRVTRGPLTVVQSDAFEVTSGGESRLVANLSIPVLVGRQESTTLGIEYFNAGEVAMAVPQLQLHGSDNAILTLDPALNGRGLVTSSMPPGFSSTVTFTAAGSAATPGILQPGETFRTSVYYRGLLQPWNLSDTETTFSLSVQEVGDSAFREIISKTVPVVTSLAADAMFGPVGLGLPNFIASRHQLPYRIQFENGFGARVPAQEVVVTSQLDQNLDWTTFEWTAFGFGRHHVTLAPHTRHHQSRIATVLNGQPLDVLVNLDVNLQTGLITTSFRSLDPDTSLPPSVLLGFLPPEDGTGRGEGYVTYLVRPRAGLATGTPIRSVAQIVFDGQRTVATDQAHPNDPAQGGDPARQLLVTLDDMAPESRVVDLPARVLSPDFLVSWGGDDDVGGSGLARYDVYVATDGGPFVPWLKNSTATSATFRGAFGHRYSFWSLATDRVGNREPTPTIEDATTLVVDPRSPPLDIRLSSRTVSEHAPMAWVVGTWTTDDVNPHDQPTFELFDSAEERFVIVGNELRLASADALDFETATSHTIQVKATNLVGFSLIKSFTIEVMDANEPPTSVAISSHTVVENSERAVIGTISVTDPDAADTFLLAVDDGRFEVVEGELRLKVGQSLDFETSPRMQLAITATDSGGLKLTRPFTLNVMNVNEPPTGISLADHTVQENAAGFPIGGVNASDPDADSRLSYRVSDDRFEIADGILRLRAEQMLDFESEPSVTLTITVTDDGGLWRSEIFVLSVVNVNEPPTSLLLSADTVLENVAGATIGGLSVVDPDANSTFTFRVSDDRFEVTDGMLRLKGGKSLDFESTPSVPVTITVVDQGGLELSQNWIVLVIDMNEPPSAILLASNIVLENVPGDAIGGVEALDPDARSTLTLKVDDDRFEIIDRILRLKAGRMLDFERDAPLQVTITATDDGGLKLDQTFALNLVDVNEPPAGTASIPDQAATAKTKFHFVVATHIFRDPDANDSLTYRANLANGNQLPAWLTFDSASRTLQGTPTNSDVAELDVRVIASDTGTPPLAAHLDFRLSVRPAPHEYPWHNPTMALDVNDSGSIEPQDALVIINDLNAKGPRRLSEATDRMGVFLDTNQDGFVSPQDVLLVINRLNRSVLHGEGESLGFVSMETGAGDFTAHTRDERFSSPRQSYHAMPSFRCPAGWPRHGENLRHAVLADAEDFLSHLSHLDDSLASELAAARRAHE